MIDSTPTIEISIKDTEPQKAVSKRTVCRPKETATVIEETLGEVHAFINKRKKKPGNGFTVYHNQSAGLVEVEVGFFVDSHPKQDPNEEIELTELPGGKAAFAVLPKPEPGYGKPHRELHQWVALQGFPVVFPLTEIYIFSGRGVPMQVEIRCWVMGE